MNKVIITMICIIAIIGAMITAVSIFKAQTNNEQNEQIKTEVAEEIYDDCTDEYESLENENIQQTNSEEEKVSPEASFSIRTYYKGCGHINNEYLELPKDLVNSNREDIEKKYPDYVIEQFASNEIVLYHEKEGECGEHYLVKDDGGRVVVYKRQSDGSQILVEETDIATDYLPETDKINMRNGIEINGKQELNKLIEDFE